MSLLKYIGPVLNNLNKKKATLVYWFSLEFLENSSKLYLGARDFPRAEGEK